MKYKLNKCEKKEIIFAKKRGQAKTVRPHTAFSQQQLTDIFNLAAKDIEINTLVHLLYDTAARM